MRELVTHEFERFKQHLSYYDENSLGNLSPFFEAKFFELQSSATPLAIIAHAYPQAKVEQAQTSTISPDELTNAIRVFFTHVEDKDQDIERMPDDFLKLMESCINYKDSKICRYDPDSRSQDELYDFIAWGFTYVIETPHDGRCLLIHGGYMD